jgi:hypothetical protein
MTNRTWIGGHAGNDTGSAANWTPAGAPHGGDDLTVVTGTLEIDRGDIAGNTLHLNDAAVGGGPVVLDLDGGARVAIDGSLQFGDPLTVNVTGIDRLDATGGFDVVGGPDAGTINLAAHAHLVTTGTMQFGYGGSLNGGARSVLTNNGMLGLGSSNSPLGKDGAVSVAVNGHGTLLFRGYHNAQGYSEISAPIASGQTVELNPAFFGLSMTLADPSDFHALLKIDPSPGGGNVAVVLDGVRADSFAIHGDRLTLTNGGQSVDTLRVANAGAVPVTASYGADTTLTFHTA